MESKEYVSKEEPEEEDSEELKKGEGTQSQVWCRNNTTLSISRV